MRTTYTILWLCAAAGGMPLHPAVGRSAEARTAIGDSVDDDVLRRIIEHWDRRAEQFRSARHQMRGESWHATGSSVFPDDIDFEPGEIPETGYPVDETTTPLSLDWLIEFERGTFRRHSEDVSFNVRNRAFRPFVRTEVFDGERPVGHWPREANTSPHFTPGRSYADVTFWGRGERTAAWIDLPVFYAHGLWRVVPPEWRSSGGLASAGAQRGADERMIDGDDCQELVITQNRSTLRFYVAERLDWLPRRVEHENLRGGLSNRLDVEYELTPEGWFPQSWRVIDFLGEPDESKNRMLKEHRLTVVQRELNLATSPDDFQVSLQPGMVVNRRDLPQFTKQRVNDDGKLVPFSEIAALESESPRWVWLVLANVIVGLIVVVEMRRKKAATAASADRSDRTASG